MHMSDMSGGAVWGGGGVLARPLTLPPPHQPPPPRIIYMHLLASACPIYLPAPEGEDPASAGCFLFSAAFAPGLTPPRNENRK